MTHDTRAAATRLAASLLFGSEVEAPDPSTLDEETFARVLVRNKVPVGVVDAALLDRSVPEGWDEVRALAAAERDRLSTSAREYGSIARAWEGRGIPAVLIKSPGYFPYTSDNVDVLVAASDAAGARSTLEELGYRELPWVREPFKILLRKVHGEPHGFAIHLHTRVAWINTFFEDFEVLDTSRPFGDDEALRRPGPERAFLVTTAHWFYEDKELKLRDLYHSREILRDDLDWGVVTAAADEGGWPQGLLSAVALLRRAADDLGLGSISSRLPDLPPPTSRLAPRFDAHPVTALPAPIERRKAKAMHFAKSLQNPRTSILGRARETALVFGYALKVRFPPLQRAPLFVVSVAGSSNDRARLAPALRAAAATLRRRFSLPVDLHEDGAPGSLRMVTTGGIHVVGGGDPPAKRGLVVRVAGDEVRVEHPDKGTSEVLATGSEDEAPLANAIARAYLESVA